MKNTISINLGLSVNRLYRKKNWGHVCVLCTHFGFIDEVTWDEDFGGYVHWSCKKSWERQEREEQRFEWEQDRMKEKEGGK